MVAKRNRGIQKHHREVSSISSLHMKVTVPHMISFNGLLLENWPIVAANSCVLIFRHLKNGTYGYYVIRKLRTN